MVVPQILAGLIAAGLISDTVYGYNKWQENMRYWNNYAKKRGLHLKYPYRLGLKYNPSGLFYGAAGLVGSRMFAEKNVYRSSGKFIREMYG